MVKTKEKTDVKEKKRLEALYSYNILDTIAEEDYDNLTQIAAQICGTKISLVSLVDKDRQWFKSRCGTGVTESPRSISFCSHAIKGEQDIMIVNDARKDPRFANNPLVTENNLVIFYAGVPVKSASGYALGTICVIDDKPRELSDSQIKALKALGKQVENLIELRKSKIELEQSSREQKKLQLQYMAASLNPNNLYSGLIAFQSLSLEKGPEKALDFASLLSKYLRRKYEFSTELFIPLSEELKNAEYHLKYEEKRTGKEFNLEIYNSLDPVKLQVPPLILHPVISNAVVHGFATMKSNSEILISIKKKGKWAIIMVEDNGAGRQQAIDTSKTRSPKFSPGLSKLQKRCEIYSELTGEKFDFKIEDKGTIEQPLGTKVIFRVPFKVAI